MPESDPAVRRGSVDLLKRRGIPKRTLEIGVGSGFYGKTIKRERPDALIEGIEVWDKYITNQRDFYSQIHICDVRKFDWEKHGTGFDLLIAADVLEHLHKPEAIEVVQSAKKFVPWIIVTIPIQDYYQGAYMGNIYETHLHQWKPKEIVSDLGLSMVEDCGICGLFEWRAQ